MSTLSPFPLNIVVKQDSLEKALEMANVPASMKYEAAEWNKIIQALNYLFENSGQSMLEENIYDAYWGKRLQPSASDVNGFQIIKSINNKIGFSAVNPSTGNQAHVSYVLRAGTGVSAFEHYGSNFSAEYVRNKGALFSDDTYFFLIQKSGGGDWEYRTGNNFYSSMHKAFKKWGSKGVFEIVPVNAASLTGLLPGMLGFDSADDNRFFYYDNTEIRKLTYLNDPKGIIKKSITVSAAQMLDLVANPVELIPAAGAGKAINLLSASFFVDYNTTPYDFNMMVNMRIEQPSSSGYFEAATFPFNESADSYGSFIKTGNGLSVNDPLLLKIINDGSQGDSPVTFKLTYTIDYFN